MMWVSAVVLGCGTRANALPLWPHGEARPVQVVMLSDLHFDPFRDPAKLPQLRSAPVSAWASILEAPDAATQAADYAKLQTACHARGVDSSWAVVRSSLEAAHADAAPLFVTVSGDLLTHNFECRFKTLDPKATAEDLAQFAMKTVSFLALQLHEAFAAAPVYLALGNNDSGCANYRQTPGSAFLRSVDESMAAEFAPLEDRAAVVKSFTARGDYSTLLPGPMHRTRLIVLQDVFATPAYGDCSGKTGDAAAREQVNWLGGELAAAKKRHETAWVMAHVPPGVDAFASFHRFVGSPAKLCAANAPAPVMMLGSDALNDTLTAYAGTVKLALFGHTHMDEFKLLHNGKGAAVPAKLVPSVSPVNGNLPAFTVATVDPRTALMQDYAVYVAGDARASNWHKEYQFTTAYRMPDYSANTVAVLSRLMETKGGGDDVSVTYRRWFFPGDDGSYAQGLKTVWPAYACAIGEDDAAAVRSCMCPAGP